MNEIFDVSMLSRNYGRIEMFFTIVRISNTEQIYTLYWAYTVGGYFDRGVFLDRE